MCCQFCLRSVPVRSVLLTLLCTKEKWIIFGSAAFNIYSWESNEATLKPCSGTSWMKMLGLCFSSWHDLCLNKVALGAKWGARLASSLHFTPFSSKLTREEVSSPCKYARCDQSQSSPATNSTQLPYFAFTGLALWSSWRVAFYVCLVKSRPKQND